MAAMSNMITPAAQGKLDESNDMLIKDFTLAHQDANETYENLRNSKSQVQTSLTPKLPG